MESEKIHFPVYRKVRNGRFQFPVVDYMIVIGEWSTVASVCICDKKIQMALKSNTVGKKCQFSIAPRHRTHGFFNFFQIKKSEKNSCGTIFTKQLRNLTSVWSQWPVRQGSMFSLCRTKRYLQFIHTTRAEHCSLYNIYIIFLWCITRSILYKKF